MVGTFTNNIGKYNRKKMRIIQYYDPSCMMSIQNDIISVEQGQSTREREKIIIVEVQKMATIWKLKV